MAIQFARLEMVKRSAGQNSCRKAAYNGRAKIHCERENQTFDFSKRRDLAHHEVLLPKGASEKFKEAKILWNEAENRETRINSQVAREMVLALPDDGEVPLEKKVELARGFIQEQLVDKGLAAQLDIHYPHRKADHNWHAHVLLTTRRFTDSGEKLGAKARDLDAEVRKGKVIDGARWGKLWRDYQNQYFEKHGFSLRVDPKGIVPQVHLGPVRLRGRAYDMLKEHEELQQESSLLSKDPKQILQELTKYQSTFTREEAVAFLNKHAQTEHLPETSMGFWNQENLVSLEDASLDGGEMFTTRQVQKEEERILRIADRINERQCFTTREKHRAYALDTIRLTDIQRNAFEQTLKGQRLSCIRGRAGSGKSYLIRGLNAAYQKAGYKVRGFAPTSEVARDLAKQGIDASENIHRFLFGHQHGNRHVSRKEVWVVDEAGMVGNQALQELLKEAWKHRCQLILIGDDAQLPSVDRGGMYRVFCEKYGAVMLDQVQRQESASHREMATELSKGRTSFAIERLVQDKALHWSDTKEQALEALVKRWSADRELHPGQTAFVVEHRNKYARVTNELLHQLKMSRGELGEEEFQCETFLGATYLSEGDRIQFRANDTELDVTNGELGTLVMASEKQFRVMKDDKREVVFNPQKFHKYQLGYAGTYHRSQGKTVDRAYVLHSPWTNKNLFYVGLTRHRKEVHYFVSRDEAKNLTGLKYQVHRDGSKRTAIEQSRSKEPSLHDASFTKRFMTHLQDRMHHNSTFYRVDRRNKEVGKYRVEKTDDWRHNDENSYQISLSQEKKSILDEKFAQYLDAVEDASQNRALYELEDKGGEDSISYKSWQQSIGYRNRLAYELTREVGKEKALWGESFKEMIKRHADRHELYLEQQKEFAKGGLSQELNNHVESICARLFPEGPVRKNGQQMRFRSNNSLSVAVSGSKRGTYYDFVAGEGGNLLSLIKNELHLSNDEAKSWAKEFLAYGTTREIPKQFKALPSKENTWVSLKPDPSVAPPELKKDRGLMAHYAEAARYAYRDREGGLLYYVLRLESKEDPSKKITPPLSYGHLKEGSRKPHWRFKGYEEARRTLFNLHDLSQRSRDKVLIVEGEKSAEAASKLLPGHVCVTWSGGASAVSKTDWSMMRYRDVIIWPDNDKAGFQACDELCSILKGEGTSSLKVVDQNMLKERFPEKWDLADSLPEGMTPRDLEQALVTAKSIDRPYDVLFEYMLQSGRTEGSLIDKMRYVEIMQMLEKSLGIEANSRNGLSDPVHEAYEELIGNRGSVEQKIREELGVSGYVVRELATQCEFFKARHGRDPTSSEISVMREVLSTHGDGSKKIDGLEIEKSLSDGERKYISEKVISKVVEVAIAEERIPSREEGGVWRHKFNEQMLGIVNQEAQLRNRSFELSGAQEMSYEKQRGFDLNETI